MASNKIPPAVQYHANKERIFAMRAERWPVKSIYQTLKQEGLIDFSYTHFAKLIRLEESPPSEATKSPERRESHKPVKPPTTSSTQPQEDNNDTDTPFLGFNDL